MNFLRLKVILVSPSWKEFSRSSLNECIIKTLHTVVQIVKPDIFSESVTYYIEGHCLNSINKHKKTLHAPPRPSPLLRAARFDIQGGGRVSFGGKTSPTCEMEKILPTWEKILPHISFMDISFSCSCSFTQVNVIVSSWSWNSVFAISKHGQQETDPP